jgi:4-amino-4-deoxy-L-arabinose transferase-like glycosyltransferase
MIINKNLIVTYFDGKPDMWNTKPPLLIWFIALSMKYFGFNEFALRLPSAICGMTTAVILFLFCKNYFHDLRAGIASGLVLITSLGFIREHVARTGDYDAMLVLWVVAYSISFFSYLHTRKQRQYLYLLIATIALVLAVWTKGIAGLMCLPGILLYTAWQKKLKKLLFSPEFYIAVTFFLVSSLGYYLLREYYNPGYINAVVKNELTGRYLNTVENNSGGFLFYYKDLISFKFIPWIYLLPF